MLVPRKLIVM